MDKKLSITDRLILTHLGENRTMVRLKCPNCDGHMVATCDGYVCEKVDYYIHYCNRCGHDEAISTPLPTILECKI